MPKHQATARRQLASFNHPGSNSLLHSIHQPGMPQARKIARAIMHLSKCRINAQGKSTKQSCMPMQPATQRGHTTSAQALHGLLAAHTALLWLWLDGSITRLHHCHVDDAALVTPALKHNGVTCA